MLRKSAGVLLLLLVAGLVSAQDKNKDKAGKDPVPKIKATIVEVDPAKMLLSVKMADGKNVDLTVGKEVKFFGPRGGKATIKDARLKPGVVLGLVMEGKTLKEVHIPVITTKKPDEKGKDTTKSKLKDKKPKDQKPKDDK